ncbi:MAG: molybdopterin-dependent oxidoreductase [Gemmatimonadales bacterium]|jgi:anaerobic selenocysteine-containing dehydrogenase|nr:MAG: molybdopterin-dependent oxidoreductase [Gemmatimonadales bacterium]
MPVYTTACPRNCYSTCTLRVEVQDGRVRRIEGHRGNRATPEGPCLKGLSYAERVHSPERILHPLRRTAGGSFARVGWDEALDELTQRLQEVRTRHGPRSVLYYSASGTKGLMNRVGADFWRLFGGYTTTYGDLCWPAGLEATRLTLGANKHNAPWDLENAGLIVFWGKNAAETNIHQGVFADRAMRRGAKVVVVDPRRTQTAEGAHLLLQPRPGSDGALALAVARLLVERGAVDRPFVERHVKGYAEYEASLAPYTPAWAAETCGIPEHQVRELAELVATSGPVSINAGYGMQRYANSGQTIRAILTLLVLTGNIGKPGAGWIFADLQSHLFDDVKDPLAFFPPERDDGVARVSISTARLGEGILAQRDPPVRFLWVERGNPVTQNPDTHRVLEAIRSLDFRVVVEQFLTDTAAEADLVLPAKTLFEQTDVIGAYWHPYVQLKQKILEPPGEVRPESEIYWALAERLGIPLSDREGVLPAPGDAEVSAYLERYLAPFPELTLERLAQGPVIAPGHQEVAFSDFVFPTPSGKIELRSEEAVERWGVDPLPGWAPPADREALGLPVRDDGERGAPDPARRDVEWLHFLTPNTKNRIHSQFNNLATIRALSPGPFLQMHPKDAAARGIVPGDRVRIWNDRGELEAPVRLDRGIRPGCVAMTNGWWITEGGTVNVLSPAAETDMGYGAAFHETRVRVGLAPR